MPAQRNDADHGEWDVVVIGTGMGGATLGRALADRGHQVLFVERGRDLRPSAEGVIRGRFVEDSPAYRALDASARRNQLAMGGRAWEAVSDGLRGNEFVPFLGHGTGGSSSLYGMVLERLFPADLTEERGWPIEYEEMRPWYEAAEQLFRVRGTVDPVRGEPAPHLLQPPPLSPANTALNEQLSDQGVHPYRLHLACERHQGCTMCQGYLCPSVEPCKNDALSISLLPALNNPNADLLTDTQVTALEADRQRITRVWAVRDGAAFGLRARVVVLAAGALATPAVLLGSASAQWPNGVANRSGAVGRHLMRHVIDLYMLRKAPRLEGPDDAKEIGFSDFYSFDGCRLGTVQSFGRAPPSEYLRNQPGFNIWRWLGPAGAHLAKRFAGAPILASVLEDLPNADNRVTVEKTRVRIIYRLGQSETSRRAIFRRALHGVLRNLGPVTVSGTDDRKGLGHVCGTCRMGSNATTSVVDRWNRAHDLDNLYIADASFFPTSGGVNPALTIAANALRLAREVAGRL